MKITIYGSGYVGLVTGALIADVGNDVLCVDVDETKVANLKKGIIPIFEPGLDDVIKRNVDANRLDFTTDMDKAVEHSEIQFIVVGSPFVNSGQSSDERSSVDTSNPKVIQRLKAKPACRDRVSVVLEICGHWKSSISRSISTSVYTRLFQLCRQLSVATSVIVTGSTLLPIPLLLPSMSLSRENLNCVKEVGR